MQRLGRGGRGKGTKAIGLYLVEPVYCDGHKRKRIYGVSEDAVDNDRHHPTKRRKNTAVVEEGGVISEGRSEGIVSNSEDSSPTEKSDLPMEQITIEKDPGTIVFPIHRNKPGPEFEEEVMDLYINAKPRSIC